MQHQPISDTDDLKKSYGKNIPFGRVVVWCGVNGKIIHFAKASIFHSAKHPFFYSSFYTNHPGAKWQVRQSPNQ